VTSLSQVRSHRVWRTRHLRYLRDIGVQRKSQSSLTRTDRLDKVNHFASINAIKVTITSNCHKTTIRLMECPPVRTISKCKCKLTSSSWTLSSHQFHNNHTFWEQMKTWMQRLQSVKMVAAVQTHLPIANRWLNFLTQIIKHYQRVKYFTKCLKTTTWWTWT